MKQLNILLATLIFCLSASAQTDTTAEVKKNDTMRIGNIIIIKKGKKITMDTTDIEMGRKNFERKQKSRLSTNWWIVDLGFANYDDQTNYNTAGNYFDPYQPSPVLSKGDFKLRTGKSVNVNIWVFMQRLNLIRKNVNLKYGLGVELNNYRYKSNISYKENGVFPYTNNIQTANAFVFRDSISFSKNKLAADYITIPLMLNFSTTPRYHKQALSFSVGVSGGYLYSQRNKQVSDERGKKKNRGDYDLEKFKYSYIAELGIGPIRFYGSYSPQSIYERGLDIRPYNFGVRFSSW